ncbi:MAG: HAD hydrolase-like protein, partial [Spirochaetales bacterium]|nr:HAD hydrolase-like protein [Spirochaetales bacterium]
MYDRLCTDLSLAHPARVALQQYSDRLDVFPLQRLDGPMSRYLLVTDRADSVEKAQHLGMGSVLADEQFGTRSLLPHLAWVDSPIPDSCSLFLFDMGNVVVKNITMLGKIARRFNLDREEFFADYLHYEFPLMEGVLSSEQYWAHVNEMFGVEVEGDPFFDAFEPVFNNEVVTLIRALRKAGKRVVCASNTIDPHWRILESMGALDLFDEVYASHLMRTTKPSRYFFEQILRLEGCSIEDAYFVDDHELNIQRARMFGLASLLYADKTGRFASERLAA